MSYIWPVCGGLSTWIGQGKLNLVMQQISERSVNFDLPYLWEPCLSSIYNLYTYLYFLTITRVKNQVNEYKCISSNCFQKHNQILHTQKLIDLYKNIDTVKQGEYFFIFLIYFFSVRLLSVLRGHSISIPDLIYYLFFLS